MKIIDFHLHPGYDFHGVIPPETFIDGIKKAGISHIVGCTIRKDDSYRDVAEYAEIIPKLNRESYAFYEQYPDIYTQGVQIHPNFVELSCSEIEYYHKRGARLIGELTPYLMAWREYSDKNLFEILKLADEKNMALSIHPNKIEGDMEGLVKEFPNMNIVIAHLDGYGLFDLSIELMRKYDNLSFDISAHGTDREGMIAEAVKLVGSERILFGTDYPGYSPYPFIDAVMKADITDADRENIFYKNAERVLGLG